ncbi:2-dehydro-3-deoxygluconokinase [Maribacter caenipelagi]|uniref:2-dehydro-3-deoxygluconokinase n=2 Tax=Maribacter TaxID=252356 RepID=A0A4R7CU95_9FLAO|nr:MULTISPECIES: sugar kinase [Maribacter]TDS12003.1 2-dehydro-3-deoxygluconokinase [Maribacter caenipelagi]SHJ38148.1 2-dehydro-3-deoxygluconokinase [Maribacter aquivivus]
MKKVVTFGEIMLRLAPEGFLRFSQANRFDAIYGGGESNVAVSLANYGVPVDFVTRLPKNDIGECAMMEMRKRGVGVDKIVYGGDRLGIYFLETGAVSRGSKVVYDRAHSAIAEIESGMIDWDAVFEGVEWFHWTGITPAISQGAADVCLEAVKAASAKGITISTDLNYRAKLWTFCDDAHREKIMSGLTEYCDVILGNEEDAEKHFGIHPEGLDVHKDGADVKAEAFLSVCKQMMKKFPKAKKVITTLRGSISASHNTWAGVLWDGSKMYETRQYQITDIVDRVGGGDSFMGGLIYGLLKYPEDDQNALDFAVAASCLKHTIKGDANLVTVSEVEKLMGGDASGRVAR